MLLARGMQMRMAVLLVALIASFLAARPAAAEVVTLGPGYAQIENYAGLRCWGLPESPSGWCGYIGIPDLDFNTNPYSWPYLDYNTDAIRTGLRTVTSSGGDTRILRFNTGGNVVLGESYSGLSDTDLTVDGHLYTAAQFDWTTNWDDLTARYLRLELWVGYPGSDIPQLAWSLRPGAGLQHGHVEVHFPDSYGISFRLSAVDPVPKPSALAGLATGLAGVAALVRRRKA